MASSRESFDDKIWSSCSTFTRCTITYIILLVFIFIFIASSASLSLFNPWVCFIGLRASIDHRPLMIRAATNPNLIPASNVSSRFFLLFGFLCLWWVLSAVYLPVSAMEARSLSRKRGSAEALCSANQTQMLGVESSKKLRRLPHVFSRVLELPLKSDADVSVQVSPSFFRFVVDGVCSEGRRVTARVVQVYPGVVKVVVRGHGSDEADDELQMDGLELDKWRFRLPVTTRPERATAVCVGGQLVVTVPKDPSVVDCAAWSGIDQLIEVL